MKNLMRRLHDESGVAIITAMLLSMVVVTLGVTTVGLAVHNSEQSGRDRRRVQGLAAAEAGINWYYSHLQSGAASTFVCTKTMNLGGSPATQFTAGLYNADTGAALTCPMSAATLPSSVLIRSKGSGVNLPSPSRTLESEVELIGEPGGPFGDTAVYSNSGISWPANVKIQGNEASDTDVFVNGNAALSSASVVYGNLYATGSITLRGNTQVRRDAWAGTSVNLQNSSRVLGSGIASTSSITVANAARILQDATYCTTISAGSSGVGGLRTKLCQGPPPVAAFPVFVYDASSWIADGYTVQTHSGVSACTTAKNAIKTLSGTGYKVLILITEDCTLSFSKDAPTIAGNLAIVSYGGLSVGTSTTFAATGGPWNLHMFFGIDGDGSPCNMTFGNNVHITGDVSTLMYTPCTISFGSNGSISRGQLFGGNVSLKPSFTMNFAPVPVPGFGTTQYEENVLYLREVVST